LFSPSIFKSLSVLSLSVAFNFKKIRILSAQAVAMGFHSFLIALWEAAKIRIFMFLNATLSARRACDLEKQQSNPYKNLK